VGSLHAFGMGGAMKWVRSGAQTPDRRWRANGARAQRADHLL